MKTHTRDQAAPRILAPLLLLACASCVTQARYEEANSQAKYYQRLYQDAESFMGNLEAENEMLRGELDLYRSSGPIEAGATADIDRRLEELERMASSIGGAPGDVTVLAVEGGYGLRLKESVLFDSGSASVRPDGQELLIRMGEEIRSRPFQRVWVRGHTDSDPVEKPQTKERFPLGNLQLSAARAVEVASLLIHRAGLEEGRVVIAGFGPNDPVAANDTADNKQRNRRVEIFVIEDENAASRSAQDE